MFSFRRTHYHAPRRAATLPALRLRNHTGFGLFTPAAAISLTVLPVLSPSAWNKK